MPSGGLYFHGKVIGILVVFLGSEILILVFFGVFWGFCAEMKFWCFWVCSFSISSKNQKFPKTFSAKFVFFRILHQQFGHFLGFTKNVSDEHTYHFCIKSSPSPGFWLSPQVKVWGGKITIIWRNLIDAKLCGWQGNPSMEKGLQHCIFMYVYIHCFNWIWRLEYLKTLEWFYFSLKYKGFVTFSK